MPVPAILCLPPESAATFSLTLAEFSTKHAPRLPKQPPRLPQKATFSSRRKEGKTFTGFLGQASRWPATRSALLQLGYYSAPRQACASPQQASARLPGTPSKASSYRSVTISRLHGREMLEIIGRVPSMAR